MFRHLCIHVYGFCGVSCIVGYLLCRLYNSQCEIWMMNKILHVLLVAFHTIHSVKLLICDVLNCLRFVAHGINRCTNCSPCITMTFCCQFATSNVCGVVLYFKLLVQMLWIWSLLSLSSLVLFQALKKMKRKCEDVDTLRANVYMLLCAMASCVL